MTTPATDKPEVTPLSDAEIAAMRERVDSATEGPWSIQENDDGVRQIVGPDGEEIACEPSTVRGYSSCTIVIRSRYGIGLSRLALMLRSQSSPRNRRNHQQPRSHDRDERK